MVSRRNGNMVWILILKSYLRHLSVKEVPENFSQRKERNTVATFTLND